MDNEGICSRTRRLTGSAERKKCGQQAEEVQYWESLERLRHHPTEENARAAKRALDFLAQRHQPDQGGTDEGLLRLEDASDRAMAAFRHAAA